MGSDTAVAALSLLTVFTLGPALLVELAQQSDMDRALMSTEPRWRKHLWSIVRFIQRHRLLIRLAAFGFALSAAIIQLFRTL